MSSTNRGADRIVSDAYYTPDHVARACIATIPIADTWEPHAGGGAFVRALEARRACVWASDINGAGGVRKHDALNGWPFGGSPPAWIVGNPPFDAAQEHIVMALNTARDGVAFLLRLAFLEGQDRHETFWRAHPCAEVHSFVRRPSFLERYEDGTVGPLRKRAKDGTIEMDKHGNARKAGTDSAAYGWFIWRIGYTGPTIHRFLNW